MDKSVTAPQGFDRSGGGFAADLLQSQIDQFFADPARSDRGVAARQCDVADRLRRRAFRARAQHAASAGAEFRGDDHARDPCPRSRCGPVLAASGRLSAIPTASAARFRRRRRPIRDRWSRTARCPRRAGSAAAGRSGTTRASRSANTSRSSPPRMISNMARRSASARRCSTIPSAASSRRCIRTRAGRR